MIVVQDYGWAVYGKQCCCDVASIYIIFVDLIDR